MANFHNIALSIAGPRSAINEAILLMAQNIIDSGHGDSDDRYEHFDDPSVSFERYRDLIESWFDFAFVGDNQSDRYESESAGLSFVDGGQTCSAALEYACGWALNENDIDGFLSDLSERLKADELVHVCAVHGDEGDGYDKIAVVDRDAGPAAELDDDYDSFDAAEMLDTFKRCYTNSPDSDEPVLNLAKVDNYESLSYLHAVASWREWGGRSVVKKLQAEGILPSDEKEAAMLLYRKQDECLRRYVLSGL